MEKKEREVKNSEKIRSKPLYDRLSEDEKEILDASSYTDDKEESNKILEKLLSQLSYDTLIKIVAENGLGDSKNKLTKFINENKLESKSKKDKLIYFIIDKIDYHDYMKYFVKPEINIENLQLLIKKIPGEYGKIVSYWFDHNIDKIKDDDNQINILSIVL